MEAKVEMQSKDQSRHGDPRSEESETTASIN
jgi:hypothetical protein